MSEKLAVVILAAGLGKRMGLDTPKVVVATRKSTLIEHVLNTADALNPERVVVVVGHKKDLVEEVIKKVSSKSRVAHQTEQRGTGDAAKAALSELKGFEGDVLILYGDVPLLSPETLKSLLAVHHKDKATITMLSLISDRDTAYGRVLRGKDGHVERIIELKDCSADQRKINELNPGVYVVDSSFLEPALNGLKNDNAQGEFYLTDIIETAHKEGQRISCLPTNNAEEVQGVNTPLELSYVNEALLRKQVDALINSGVLVEDRASLFVDPEVTIESGVKIGPSVQIRGKTTIKRGTVIEGSAFIIDCKIGEGCVIKLGVRMEGATLASHVSVGPFANLRPDTVLDDDVKIGNFVETKKAHLRKDAKASHLTYLGDCDVGEHSNIGAGTITCNYDGVNKHKTTIGKGVFIGSDSCLVAPVRIDDGAYVGAGSVITKDVAKDSLAFTRAPLKVKEGWAKTKRSKK